MLPKHHRLQLKGKLEKLKKEGRVVQGKHFALLLKKNKQKTNSQFAVIASKKIAKKAIERNHAKRRIFEAIREILENIKEGYEVVFLLKKPAVSNSYSQIKEEVLHTFSEAGILKKTNNLK